MGLLDFFASKTVVGLDIGSWGVKAVLLKEASKGYHLVTMGMEPLPPEVVVDGTIMDAGVVVEAIGRLFGKTGIKIKNVALGVSGTSVIVKRIKVGRRSPQELRESISFEAEQYIPFDIDDVNIDYEVIENPMSADSPEVDLILVAVKREKVDENTAIVAQSGLQPVIVDVDGFALQNCFQANYDTERGEVVALIDIGAAVMNINILHDGVHMLYRDISVGGNQYTDAMQRELRVSYEQAEALKRGDHVDGVALKDTAEILDQVTKDISMEIQRSFDYFRATTGTDQIDKVYLTGGCTKIHGIDRYFAARLGSTVEFLDPFRRIEAPKQFAGRDAAEWAPFMAVAIGLAMRRLGDK
ncbi:MAG: type IV pilus assembly protein PilM [Candidatus Schekmanbacteria bacterium]|nr:type IV pilus assembly protein PilM [Candidatus Schekmanbacteria bacterium]